MHQCRMTTLREDVVVVFGVVYSAILREYSYTSVHEFEREGEKDNYMPMRRTAIRLEERGHILCLTMLDRVGMLKTKGLFKF